jgi:hypothetical protein
MPQMLLVPRFLMHLGLRYQNGTFLNFNLKMVKSSSFSMKQATSPHVTFLMNLKRLYFPQIKILTTFGKSIFFLLYYHMIWMIGWKHLYWRQALGKMWNWFLQKKKKIVTIISKHHKKRAVVVAMTIWQLKIRKHLMSTLFGFSGELVNLTAIEMIWLPIIFFC